MQGHIAVGRGDV